MKTEIDNRLQEWAARQTDAPERVPALETRIVAAYRSSRPFHDERTSPRDTGGALSFPAHRRHWLCFAAGVAATLLAVLLLRVWPSDRKGLDALLREEGSLFAGRKPAMTRVFCETACLFGASLQCVAQSGDHAEFGLIDEPAGKGKAMVVHLSVVVRRLGDEKGWHRVWQADVVARTDGVVEVTPDGIPGNRVALWLHRLDDGQVFVESRLELNRPLRIESDSSEVLAFGASRDVMRIRQGDTEFLLLQTVAPIGGAPCSS